jgi:hypothetical protein
MTATRAAKALSRLRSPPCAPSANAPNSPNAAGSAPGERMRCRRCGKSTDSEARLSCARRSELTCHAAGVPGGTHDNRLHPTSWSSPWPFHACRTQPTLWIDRPVARRRSRPPPAPPPRGFRATAAPCRPAGLASASASSAVTRYAPASTCSACTAAPSTHAAATRPADTAAGCRCPAEQTLSLRPRSSSIDAKCLRVGAEPLAPQAAAAAVRPKRNGVDACAVASPLRRFSQQLSIDSGVCAPRRM